MMIHFPKPRVGAYLFLALLALGATLLAVRDRLAGGVGGDAVAAASATPTIDPASAGGMVLDGRRQQLIGVRTARVTRSSLNRITRANGIVRYDDSRLTDFNLKLDGWIRDVYVSYVGQPVKQGQPLFTVFSTELDALQANLVGALKTRELTPLAQAADSTQYVDRLVDAPRQRLKQWGMAEDELRVLETTRQVPPAVVFRSPVAGVVIEKSVLKGMHVESGQTLYKIVDLSTVLVEADFPEADVDALKTGTRAAITLDALPGQRFAGRVLSTYPFLNEQTRTLKVRIELPNRDGRLKPGMFANVELAAAPREGLVIPSDAVIDSGSRQTVFVAKGEGYFEPRSVTVGAKADGQVLILDGLREQEQIAIRAAFFLDSESQMRSALQDYEASSPPAAPAAPAGGLQFAVQVTPDPPRTGENVLQVQVSDENGRSITDADVLVRLSMPPMPSMNMPAMHSDARLTHTSAGVYRGPASISMAGRWDLTMTARRQGRLIGTRHATLLVR